MATWIQLGKDFHKSYIPSGVEPTNALLLEIAQAIIVRREVWWREFISQLDSIHPTLPNAMQKPGGEPWEIGTIDAEGNYDTDFSANDNNTAIAYFGPWSYRTKEAVPAVKEFRKSREALGAGADAETPDQAIARREAESRAYAVGQVGNDTDEVGDS